MGEDGLRQRKARRHEHRRPDDRVEAEDVLADQVDIGRPQPLEQQRIGAIPGRGDVVEESVDPDVEDVVIVPRHGDTPVERRPGDREVLQPLLDERDDLVASALRLDELRMLLVVVEQLLGVLREPEEVVGLRQHLDRTTVHRAQARAVLPLHQLRGDLELLAADAVGPLVGTRVDLTGVVQMLPELPDPLGVPALGGSDEVVRTRLDRVEHRLPGALHQPVGPLPGPHALGLGTAHDLLAVLIGAGEEPHRLAALPMPPGQDVGRDSGIGMPDMRRVVHVVDRGRDIERLAFAGVRALLRGGILHMRDPRDSCHTHSTGSGFRGESPRSRAVTTAA